MNEELSSVPTVVEGGAPADTAGGRVDERRDSSKSPRALGQGDDGERGASSAPPRDASAAVEESPKTSQPRRRRARAPVEDGRSARAAPNVDDVAATREGGPAVVQRIEKPMNEIEQGPERETATSERAKAETIVLDAGTRERLGRRRQRDREAVTPPPGTGQDTGAVTERFVTALDQRLEKSQLEELGWKGREDLDDVMRDLRRLAAADFERASDLWSKYRPNDKDKPPFLDSDEWAEARRRGDKDAPASRNKSTDREEESAEFVTPASLRRRFLQTQNKFYFRNDENTLAFEDRGRQLVTTHDDPMVALSMVELAEAKGWQTLKLKGTEEFKREVWLQASLKGLEARGYSPRDVDRAKLEELREEARPSAAKSRNSIEASTERSAPARSAPTVAAPASAADRTAIVDEQQRTLSAPQRVAVDAIKAVMRSRGDSDRAIDMAASLAAERFQTNRVYVGKVLDAGFAPYENVSTNEQSYYVKLSTPEGEKPVWGVDLRRAMEEGAVKIGDDVAVAYQGRQQVTVKVKDRDEAGKVVGESEIVTNRNTWDVRRLETLREEAQERLGKVAQSADRAPDIRVYDRDAARTAQRPDIRIERPRVAERSR